MNVENESVQVDLSNLKYPELQKMAKMRGLKANVSKIQLIKNITDFDMTESTENSNQTSNTDSENYEIPTQNDSSQQNENTYSLYPTIDAVHQELKKLDIPPLSRSTCYKVLIQMGFE